jgi:basic membrane protein A
MTGRRWKAWAVVVAVAGTLSLAVAACDNEEPAATGATTTEAPLKAGLVSDVGKFNDRSFNQSALEGLNRAESELGVQGRPIESRAASDYIPNLSTLARQKYGVTIGVGFLMADAMDTVAREFPNQKFAIVDFSQAALKNKPPNVRGLVFSTNENSYLVGYLSALMVKKQGGKQVISAVGGIKLPTVDIFIAGYRAGAKAANPDIKVLIDYSQDFVAQDKCKELALKQIQGGSQVVFQVAGGCGLGALDAAKERKVWGIGVDRDQAFLGDHILTSAVKRVDVSVFDTIKDAKEGTFSGGDKSFTLANGGVALGKVSSKVPQEFLDQIEDLKAKIIAGEITAPTTL